MPQEPWFPHCMRCAIKHSLGLEQHLGEAIERAARYAPGDVDKYVGLLAKQIDVRKGLEEIYFSDESMVSLSVGFDVDGWTIKKALDSIIEGGE